ncbi:MAG: hypothetical protein U9R74_10265 [Pseudomonadota bacterium]|nr:hypothetical protein [Pseudomonadota bacterium]
MEGMQKKMAEIKQIKGPAERHERMQKHLQEMTTMMHKMNEEHPSMSGQEQQLHLKMLESRLDLLQGMLTQGGIRRPFHHPGFRPENEGTCVTVCYQSWCGYPVIQTRMLSQYTGYTAVVL